MKDFKFTKIPCQASWATVLDKSPDIHHFYMKQHQKKYEKDYDYIGNLDLDFSNFFDIEKGTIGFYSRGVFNALDGKRFDINDELILDIREKLGFEDCVSSLQNLQSGKVTLSHFDIPSLKTPEKIVTHFYNYLNEKHSNFQNLSIDKVYNIMIIFLEDWAQGQAFMIGRSCFNNWKKGDVISFPWYMEHSTVNASFKDRHILYFAGSFA